MRWVDNNGDGMVDNLSYPATEELRGHWLFNGNYLDRTPNANHGIAYNGIGFTTGMDGTPNGALLFDGVFCRVDMNNIPLCLRYR